MQPSFCLLWLPDPAADVLQVRIAWPGFRTRLADRLIRLIAVGHAVARTA